MNLCQLMLDIIAQHPEGIDGFDLRDKIDAHIKERWRAAGGYLAVLSRFRAARIYFLVVKCRYTGTVNTLLSVGFIRKEKRSVTDYENGKWEVYDVDRYFPTVFHPQRAKPIS